MVRIIGTRASGACQAANKADGTSIPPYCPPTQLRPAWSRFRVSYRSPVHVHSRIVMRINEGFPQSRRDLRSIHVFRAADGHPSSSQVGKSLSYTPIGRGVVITGGTKGLGFAMAAEFIRGGDRVLICSRSPADVEAAVDALRQMPGCRGNETTATAFGCVCDVGVPADIEALGQSAKENLGTIHIWINNAGQVTAKRLLADVSAEEILSAVSTNVTGSLLGSREAIQVMREQPGAKAPPSQAGLPGGIPGFLPYRIFNLGFSRWGAAFTRSAATHKATKTALTQLTASLTQELQQAGLAGISIHNLSPGMVLTDLLLKDSTPAARRFFNALAEEPETVAAEMVPRLRALERSPAAPGSSIDFLTPAAALLRVATSIPQIVGGGRFFDADGSRVPAPGEAYGPSGVRLQWRREVPQGARAASEPLSILPADLEELRA